MADNRTEKPTIRHRREAEKRGQILRGRDLVSGLTLMAVILVIAGNPQEWILRWRVFSSRDAIRRRGRLERLVRDRRLDQSHRCTVAGSHFRRRVCRRGR